MPAARLTSKVPRVMLRLQGLLLSSPLAFGAVRNEASCACPRLASVRMQQDFDGKQRIIATSEHYEARLLLPYFDGTAAGQGEHGKKHRLSSRSHFSAMKQLM